jgi:hypothetical protein
MDLSKAKAVEAGSNDDETTTTTQSGEVTRHQPNEVADGYAAFSDSSALVEAISTQVLDNEPSYKVFDIKWEHDLEDYPDIVEGVEATKQQKLVLIHKLTKSTFGAKQSELNSGYGMGWDNDKSPPKPYKNKEGGKVHYLSSHPSLSTFDHETLGGEEVAELENEGLDMENHGFDRSVIGPYLPKINGKRVPIIVEDGDEVMKALEMLDSIDWDEVTYCEENGELQGTPSLGPSESDSDKGGEVKTDNSDEVFNLAENPERVNEVNVTHLRGQGPEEFNVSNIDNRRTIQLLVRYESEGKTRKGAMERLKQRRSALKKERNEEDEPSPETTSDDTEVVADGGDDYEWSEADKELMTTLIQSGQAEGIPEAKEIIKDQF